MKSHALLLLPITSRATLNIAVQAAYVYNCQWLIENPITLEEFRRIRYHTEPIGRSVEQVRVIPQMLKDLDGDNDCEDISAGWAAFETIINGRQAEPKIIDITDKLQHCIVIYKDGSTNDPNILAGMR